MSEASMLLPMLRVMRVEDDPRTARLLQVMLQAKHDQLVFAARHRA